MISYSDLEPSCELFAVARHPERTREITEGAVLHGIHAGSKLRIDEPCVEVRFMPWA